MQPKNCSKLLSPCEGVDLLNRSSLRWNISSWPLCRERRIHTVTRNTLLWIRRRGLMGPPQRRSHLPCSKEYRRELSAEDFGLLLSCMDVVHLHDGMKDENCLLEGLGVGDTLVYLNRTEPWDTACLIQSEGHRLPPWINHSNPPKKILTHTSARILNFYC